MLGNEMYNPGMVLHLFKILPKNKLFCVCRYTYYCSGYLGLGVKKETCCEVVLSDAECEWQGFVCPLQCSLAQVAAPGTAQLLHHCMGEQRWAQPSPAGKPQGSCSWEPAPRGETQITPTQGSKERNMQLLGAGALKLPCSPLEIKCFQKETDPSLILLFGAEFTLPLMSAHSHG